MTTPEKPTLAHELMLTMKEAQDGGKPSPQNNNAALLEARNLVRALSNEGVSYVGEVDSTIRGPSAIPRIPEPIAVEGGNPKNADNGLHQGRPQGRVL